MKHTAEPWRIEVDEKCADFSWIVSGETDEVAMISDGRIEDARRIVACVNACAGISTNDLERNYNTGGGIDSAMDEASLADHVGAVKLRDELAEAIRLTLEENGHLADGEVCTLKRIKDALVRLVR